MGVPLFLAVSWIALAGSLGLACLWEAGQASQVDPLLAEDIRFGGRVFLWSMVAPALFLGWFYLVRLP